MKKVKSELKTPIKTLCKNCEFLNENYLIFRGSLSLTSFDGDLMKNNLDFQKMSAKYDRRLGEIPGLEYSYYLLAIIKKLVIGTSLSKAEKLLTRLTLEHSLLHIMSKIRSFYLLEVGETLNLKQQENILDIISKNPLIKNKSEPSIKLLLTWLRQEYTRSNRFLMSSEEKKVARG